MLERLLTETLAFIERFAGPLGVLAALLFVFTFLYHFYFRLPQRSDLTGEHIDTGETVAAYCAFRDRVRRGGLFGGGYSNLLRSVLPAVDRFFHDGRKTAPTWTSASMDRLLGLAVAYPIVSMLAVWWLTGQVGPAERAIWLEEAVPGHKRAAGAAWVIFVIATVTWVVRPPESHKTLMWTVVRYAEFAFAVLFAGAVGVAFAVAEAFEVAGAGATEWLNDRKPGAGWWLYFSVLLVAPSALILGLPRLIDLDAPPEWTLLLILLVLPLINALFDWVSLGLTRKLLRDGLYKGGLWPFVNAAVDVFAAIILLFALLVVCLAYIHGMNIAALAAGSPPVLDVSGTLEMLRSDAENPSLWWIYVTVFTTFIPSLVNLCLGGLAIVRGIPGLNPFLVERFLPEDPRGLTINRRFAASLGLTFQTGIALVGAGFVGWLAFTLVFTGLDHVGLGLVTVAETVNGALSDLFPMVGDPKL
jgi:hypothetical protein